MKTIRHGTFETNSSSTHSLLILTEEEDKKLNSGEMFITSAYDYTIINKEKRDELLKTMMDEHNAYLVFLGKEPYESVEQFLESDHFEDNRSDFPMTLDDLFDYNDGSNHDMEFYTSPSGDNLIIHAFYGYDS
jgi:hypothetical protein